MKKGKYEIVYYANEDCYLEVSSDGYPRYYMKAIPGVDNNKPIPAEEQLRQIRLAKEGPKTKLCRYYFSLFLFWFLRAVDLWLIYQLVESIPLWCCGMTGIFIYFRYQSFRQAVFYWGTDFKLPIIQILIPMVFYPLMIVFGINLFFAIDDLIEGPMYRNPWYQQLHLNIKNNLSSFIQDPSRIKEFFPET